MENKKFVLPETLENLRMCIGAIKANERAIRLATEHLGELEYGREALFRSITKELGFPIGQRISVNLETGEATVLEEERTEESK